MKSEEEKENRNGKDQEERTKPDEHEKKLEDRLEEMLKLNWIMLPESCTIESCNCPLMMSPNGQKYCAGCEAWEFDHERPEKHNHGEVANFNTANTGIQLKESKISKRFEKQSFPYALNQSVIQCLQTKLFFFVSLLNSETDVNKCKDILITIKICLENIKMTSSLNKEM